MLKILGLKGLRHWLVSFYCILELYLGICLHIFFILVRFLLKECFSSCVEVISKISRCLVFHPIFNEMIIQSFRHVHFSKQSRFLVNTYLGLIDMGPCIMGFLTKGCQLSLTFKDHNQSIMLAAIIHVVLSAVVVPTRCDP